VLQQRQSTTRTMERVANGKETTDLHQWILLPSSLEQVEENLGFDALGKVKE
jgi:hypothetical protein